MPNILPIIDYTKVPKHAVFIVIDAGRYDYLERYSTPNIDTLIENGVSYRNAVAGTCIAGTNPGLATLSTGLFVKDHGVPSSYEWFNKKTGELTYFYDSEKDILHMDVPTIGDFLKNKTPAAKIASISSKDRHALLMAGKHCDIVVYSYRESVFRRNVYGAYKGAGVSDEYYSWAERVNHSLPAYLKDMKLVRSVDWEGEGFKHTAIDVADTSLVDPWIMDSAVKILENEKPDLFFIGLVSPNIAAHAYGYDSPECRNSIETIDAQIGKLVKKLKEMDWFDETLIVITSDHGMSYRPNGVDVISELKKKGFHDVVDNVLHLTSGGTGGFYINDTSSYIIEKTIRALKKTDHIKEAWYKHDPKAPWYIRRFVHERSQDIVIIPDFESVVLDEGETVPNFPYYHGPPYPPDLSIMLIFSGAGVKKLGKIGKMLNYLSVETISEKEIEKLPEQAYVAPTMKTIMKIEE